MKGPKPSGSWPVSTPVRGSPATAWKRRSAMGEWLLCSAPRMSGFSGPWRSRSSHQRSRPMRHSGTTSSASPGLRRQWMIRTSSRCSKPAPRMGCYLSRCGMSPAGMAGRWCAGWARCRRTAPTTIISGVASALDAAHAAGLVHRDVKPANMLVDARPGRPDHVYLSDFGLTKGALSSASQTGTGHFLGTPTYCAPEQIQGFPVDARADEYALACAVYALLSGEPPFPRDEGMAVLYAQLSTPPPLLTSRRPGLSPAVDDVLLRALAKAPEDRYASCGEFADALRVALGLQRYDSDVASALHQRSLVDQQHRMGLDHADTLATHASSVTASGEERLSDEAIALHQRTLIDQQQALGLDHPETLGTRFNIAQ